MSTPRSSGLWQQSVRMSRYSRVDDDDDPERNDSDSDIDDGRTPLDKTIDRIGMGTSSFWCWCAYTDQVVCRGLPVDITLTLWFR